MKRSNTVEIIAVPGIPLVRKDDDLVALIGEGLACGGIAPRGGDVFVLTQKIVSSDADEHVERIGYYVGLGFRNLVFHAPGPDQARFLKLYGEHVLPRLRKRFG